MVGAVSAGEQADARVALAVNGIFSYLATDALGIASGALDDGGTEGLPTASRLNPLWRRLLQP